MTFSAVQTLESPTGAAIALRAAIAPAPRGIIQINHGMAEHSGRYARFAGFLADRGFHVYAHDHRGHGYTKAPNTPRGSFGHGPSMPDVIADIAAVHYHIESLHPDLPVVVFGQGSGALITFDFLLGSTPRLSGAALWNMPVAEDYPARFLGAMLRWERFRLGSDSPSPTMQRIMAGWNRKVGGGRTGFEWLSYDPASVEAYAADPLRGRGPTISAWLEILRLMRMPASRRLWEGLPREFPLQLAAGAEDPVTAEGGQVERLVRRLRLAGFSNLVSSTYSGKRHDLVNSLNQYLIWEEFADWAAAAVRWRRDG